MLKLPCEVCGKRSWFPHIIDDFRVCSRCARVQKKTKTPVAELVAKNLSSSAKTGQRSSRPNSGVGSGCLFVLVVIAVFVWIAVATHEPGSNQARQPGGGPGITDIVRPIIRKFQVPVQVGMRPSFLPNMGQVLQIRNRGSVPLIDVAVSFELEGWPPQRTVIPRIDPGEIREVGGLGFNFDLILFPHVMYKIECEGYLPVTVESEPSE
ncbi:MAG: TFIIB-type zinc finger domain-containing protein [Planctomycetota bacterium]